MQNKPSKIKITIYFLIALLIPPIAIIGYLGLTGASLSTPKAMLAELLGGNASTIHAWRPATHGEDQHLVIGLDSPRIGILDESIAFRRILPEGLTRDSSEWSVRRTLGSLDASRFDYLSFWVRGEPSTASPLALEITFTLADSSKPAKTIEGHSFVLGLGPDWKQVLVPLAKVEGIDDWHRLTGINIKVIAGSTRTSPVNVFWIDEMALLHGDSDEEEETVVALSRLPDVGTPETPEEHRARLKQRLVGWPKELQIDPASLPSDDAGLLHRLAADTWRGIDDLTDRESGLPLDRIQFAAEGSDVDQAWIGDYTNITNIGFYFLSLVAANELGLIPREIAIEKIKATLTSLENVETSHGFFFNYYNTTTLARTDDLISFVDSSWLTSGLIVARQAFPEIADRASRLIAQGNFQYFYDPAKGLMSHGNNGRLGQQLKIYYGVFYTEARLGSLIGIGKGDLPEKQWFQSARTMPPEMTWQQQVPVDYKEQEAMGFRWMSGHYHWHDRDFVPSWGGSMFEALMPLLVMDEVKHAPNNLGKNDVTHTQLQRIHAMEDLHYPVWGMSPSSTADGQGYTEYGVPRLGVGGYKAGAVTPHAAVLALMTDPVEATKNIRRLIKDYPVYGEYGLYDAVDPFTHQVGRNYLCLDQAMILVALANHLKDHAVQKYFAQDPIIQRTLPLLKIEKF
ncbi:MAG: hypothetical protein RLZ25_615 [Pseudomonadota bacterium]|jgi:hypothetical protein